MFDDTPAWRSAACALYNPISVPHCYPMYAGICFHGQRYWVGQQVSWAAHPVVILALFVRSRQYWAVVQTASNNLESLHLAELTPSDQMALSEAKGFHDGFMRGRSKVQALFESAGKEVILVLCI